MESKSLLFLNPIYTFLHVHNGFWVLRFEHADTVLLVLAHLLHVLLTQHFLVPIVQVCQHSRSDARHDVGLIIIRRPYGTPSGP